MTIRYAQLHALGQARVELSRALLLVMLRHHIAHEGRAWCPAVGLPAGYLDALADRSLALCRAHGCEQQGMLEDVARALWKDDDHPMSAAQLARKGEAVMADQHTRRLYGRVQALGAALQRADAASASASAQPQEQG